MVCKKCGSTLEPDAKFCSNCGMNLNEIENLNEVVGNSAETQETAEVKVEEVAENKEVLEATENKETTETTEATEATENTEKVNVDVVAEVQKEIEDEINAEINANIIASTQAIESLNTESLNTQETQTEKVQLTKPENNSSEETQNVQFNAPTSEKPKKEGNPLKVLLIILAVLIGVLVVAVVIVVVMFFTKPSLGRAALETSNQITEELEAAKAGNTIATDFEKINDGSSFTMDYYMDELLSLSGMLYGDAENITFSVDYDNTNGLFEYYLSGNISGDEFVMEIMKMTIPEYQANYVLATEENNKQLLTDATALFSKYARTKGTKLEDGKYDYEYKFKVDGYELANILTSYADRQTELQSQLFDQLEIELQELDSVEAGKLYTVLTGEPTNFYIDYMVEDYNSQLEYYNGYIADYIQEAAALYESDMVAASEDLEDVQPGDYMDVVVKTTDGKITYVSFSDDSGTIVIEASNFTSYLQSTYKIYADGEAANEIEPIEIRLDVTAENWSIELGADTGVISLDWDLVSPTDNISLGFNDGYTNEKFTGTISGDYETGITLDMNDLGKIVLIPIAE